MLLIGAQLLPGLCLVWEDTFNPLSPQHCLLGWDVFPPKSEKSSAPKSLDLWSSVSSEAQHRKLLASSPSCLVWSRVCLSLGAWDGQVPLGWGMQGPGPGKGLKHHQSSTPALCHPRGLILVPRRRRRD